MEGTWGAALTRPLEGAEKEGRGEKKKGGCVNIPSLPFPPRSFSSTPSLTVILTLWAGLEHDKDETSNQGEERRSKAREKGKTQKKKKKNGGTELKEGEGKRAGC